MEHFNPILGHETTGPKFITCGEIMLRLTPPNYEKLRMATNFEASYGGSEANIALALANLGVDSTFFSVVPNNSRMRRLPTVWVHTTSRPATASAPPRSSMTASTAPSPSTISLRSIWTSCWRASTGCT